MSLNRVMLIGYTGSQPELKYIPNGSAVVNFSLATSMKWKDQSGQQQEKTEWHRCVAWRKTAELIGQYVSKGSKLYIEGRIETRTYEKDGQKHYATEIIVESVQFLDSKKQSTEQQSQPEPPTPQTGDGLPF